MVWLSGIVGEKKVQLYQFIHSNPADKLFSLSPAPNEEYDWTSQKIAKMLKTFPRKASVSLNVSSSVGVKDLERNVRTKVLKSYYTCCTLYSILDRNKETFVSVSEGWKLCSICDWMVNTYRSPWMIWKSTALNVCLKNWSEVVNDSLRFLNQQGEVRDTTSI